MIGNWFFIKQIPVYSLVILNFIQTCISSESNTHKNKETSFIYFVAKYLNKKCFQFMWFTKKGYPKKKLCIKIAMLFFNEKNIKILGQFPFNTYAYTNLY